MKKVKTIRSGEDGFWITDGMINYPRAMLHVTPECPHQIAEAIAKASQNGWLKSVAHVYGKELTWEKLTND
jgi:predicted metal-binding protein